MARDNGGECLDPLTAGDRLRAVWVGGASGNEMRLALHWAQQQLRVDQITGVAEARRFEKDADPALVFLPLDWSGAVRTQDLVALGRRWPLAILVVVTGSCVDGFRRRGPALPGAVAVPWYEVPGYLQDWIVQRRRGASAQQRTPATSRREERLLDRFAAHSPRHVPLEAAVASGSRSLLASLELLAASAGVRVVRRHQGLPPADAPGDVLLWDVGDANEATLSHLADVHAARPTRPVLLFDSFPRGSTLLSVLDAGGSHLLGRPVETHIMSGTIRWCWKPERDGLGRV